MSTSQEMSAGTKWSLTAKGRKLRSLSERGLHKGFPTDYISLPFLIIGDLGGRKVSGTRILAEFDENWALEDETGPEATRQHLGEGLRWLRAKNLVTSVGRTLPGDRRGRRIDPPLKHSFGEALEHLEDEGGSVQFDPEKK